MNPRKFESDAETLEFLEEFCEFGPNRAYILSAMARPKENESITHGSIPMFREIITNTDAIRRKYARLQAMAQNYTPEEGGELDFRLYITANARDIQKSFFIFQRTLIEFSKNIAEGHEESREKIKRLDKEWESTLQTDGNKDDNLFIIDIDSTDTALFTEIADALDRETDILTATETPNGYHILTQPFNYPNFEPFTENENIEIKTDGLTFLRML